MWQSWEFKNKKCMHLIYTSFFTKRMINFNFKFILKRVIFTFIIFYLNVTKVKDILIYFNSIKLKILIYFYKLHIIDPEWGEREEGVFFQVSSNSWKIQKIYIIIFLTESELK